MRSKKGSNKELRNEILRLRIAMLEIVSIFEGAVKQWRFPKKEIAAVWTVQLKLRLRRVFAIAFTSVVQFVLLLGFQGGPAAPNLYDPGVDPLAIVVRRPAISWDFLWIRATYNLADDLFNLLLVHVVFDLSEGRG
ncbi:hypothetical protein I6F30_33605 [Bradyrhizobium sp. NBAIM20]|uniref:hypothetical protein n=1 Tax=unclassified Bradyrhizobium TaxID=2631580 RepID=UPI001CD448D5|nr:MULTISPECIES: hypothetical protein [unclassified Bradyrhizobium]MCA1416025.1 hypothetical protein [Bradyrhizobium sp. NBAIM20]MCA1466065.1 hypothetical protein [Bradyrhizobium sp. NBAIM18]